MASYSNSNYTNDLYNLSGIYFNSTSSSTGAINTDELDKRYLLKSGGNISNNLVVGNILDVKNSLTLPNIGNVENNITALSTQQNTNTSAIEDLQSNKQDVIEDNSLSISKIINLQSSLNNKQNKIGTGSTLDLNTLNARFLVVTDEFQSNYGTFSQSLYANSLSITAGLESGNIKSLGSLTYDGNMNVGTKECWN